MGCDCNREFFSREQSVSIHAPAWGATTGDCLRQSKGLIHAPAWGATMAIVYDKVGCVSTTHPHGATNDGPACPAGGVANPRTRMGETYAVSASDMERVTSTHPHGCDKCNTRPCPKLFSNAPAWVRRRFSRVGYVLCVSIHAPAGCDEGRGSVQDESGRAIHAPAWGATVGKSTQCLQRSHPRTRMGCDLSGGNFRDTSGVSIHAPAWGATYTIICFVCDRRVSIHAPAWGATLSGR